MDWLQFYSLKGEPFGPQPLRRPAEFRDVFVLTEAIKTEVNPIISTIEYSDRYLYLIFGERGAGKSTLIHYIINQLNSKKNILTVDISLIKRSYQTQDPGYGIATDLTTKVALKTLEEIINKCDRIYKKHVAVLDEFNEVLMEEKGSNLDKVGTILRKIFIILNDENINPIIFIDNLDKFNKEFILEFLGFRYAQALFEETFFPYEARVFLVSDQSWLAELKHSDYSYLGEPISIKPLNYAETQTLIQRKMKKKATDPDNFKFPFNEESIIFLGNISNGNPRKIQEKCRIALIEGANNDIEIINRDFLIKIQNDLGNEFELIKDLLINHPIIERNLAWLLEVRGKFEDAKSFENALIDILKFRNGKELDSDVIEHLRNYELISLEKLDKSAKYFINPILENLFNKIKTKMEIDNFIKWFSRTEADTISISHIKLSIEELNRICESLPDFKKDQAHKALKNHDLFKQCYLEDEDRNECVDIAFHTAENLIGIIIPEILAADDDINMYEVIKAKTSREISSDYHILRNYFIQKDLNLSSRDVEVVSEKINNIIESILNILDKFTDEKIPYSFSDAISFGNFVKNRIKSPGFLFLSPQDGSTDESFFICWVADSGLHGLSRLSEKYLKSA